MRTLVLAAFLFLVPVCSITLSSDADKNRPVSKVVTLLKDMVNQLQKEAAEDEEIYEKMACWCKTNDRDKTKAIKKAEETIETLTTRIETLTATAARLNTEIEHLKQEIADNQEALATATSIRNKQVEEFNKEEADLIGSIQALQGAVAALKKHNENGFLQMKNSHLLGIAAMVENEMKKHDELLQGVLTNSERNSVAEFVQDPAGYLGKANNFNSQYAPQSGTVYGILQQMLEEFQKNLKTSQDTEAARQQSFVELKAAKEGEIEAGQQMVERKTESLADTDKKKSDSITELDSTNESLSADSKYLMNLKEKCSLTDKQMEERRNTRSLEIQAVSKALAFLSSDDAQDLVDRTLTNAFIQKSSTVKSDRRNAAAAILAQVAKKTESPILSNLAVRVRLDAFTEVKKAIDEMIAQLGKEKADEIKHKDFCIKGLDENQLEQEAKTRKRKDHETMVEDLTMEINECKALIEKLKADISSMQVQLKRASEDREAENKEFQTTVADQRATQKLLQQALGVLEEFYGKQSLIQQEPAGPPPPEGFKEYKNNEGSGGVMGMIQQIIKDAKAMEEEALKDENSAEEEYSSFVKNTGLSVDAKVSQMTNTQKQQGDAEVKRSEENQGLDETKQNLEDLSDYASKLHDSCDYTLKNFDLRQTARDEEVEALKKAKAILSGADFTEFLQTAV